MFAYKERAPWSEFVSILDSLFLNNTGRGLTQEHRDYLVKLLPGQCKLGILWVKEFFPPDAVHWAAFAMATWLSVTLMCCIQKT